jgi:hypothetical protein
MVPANGFRWGITSRKAARMLVPKLEELRADDRPILDAVRRRWNHQVTSPQICGEILYPFHGTQAKSGRRPDDEAEIDDRENCRCEPRPTAEKLGKDLEDRIERNGEYDAPGQDRHKGTDENERPIDQESQQSEPDRKLDEVLSGPGLAKGFQGRLHLGMRSSSYRPLFALKA